MAIEFSFYASWITDLIYREFMQMIRSIKYDGAILIILYALDKL